MAFVQEPLPVTHLLLVKNERRKYVLLGFVNGGARGSFTRFLANFRTFRIVLFDFHFTIGARCGRAAAVYNIARVSKLLLVRLPVA